MVSNIVTSSTLIIDGVSMFGSGEAIADREGIERVNFDYGKLKEILIDKCEVLGWQKGKNRIFDQAIVMVSTDPKSETQGRFVKALERIGYLVDAVNFREVFVSLPPGRFPPSQTDRAAGDRSRGLASMAPRITYLAGLLAKNKNLQLLVVSHAYEMLTPLRDLAGRVKDGGGHVGLAYFGTLLDQRYHQTGIIERRKLDELDFIDLDPYLSELTGISQPNSGATIFAKFVL